jgi:hypothetical protein
LCARVQPPGTSRAAMHIGVHMNKYILPVALGVGITISGIVVDRIWFRPKPNALPAEIPPVNEWRYIQQKDEMDGSYSLLASIESNDDMRTVFGMLRSTRNTASIVALSTENGQFDCSPNCVVLFKFDDEAPQKFEALRNPNGGSSTIVIEEPREIVRKIYSTRKLVINVPYYRYGRNSVVFDVSNYNVSEHLKTN